MSLRTRLGLRLFRHYRHTQARLHDLQYLFWECTLRCNLSCIHCGSDCTRNAATPDMPMSDFLRVADSVVGATDPHKVMIAITGGEPLMRSDLDTCGKELHRRGFPWGIVTNGMLLNKKRLDSLIASGLRSVTVSLDGLAVSHDWMRNRDGAFDGAVAAIRACCATPDLVFDVVTCVNQRNVHQLTDVRSLLEKLGVRAWRLFTVFPKGRAREHAEMTLAPGQFRQLMDFIAATRTQGRISAAYGCEGFLGEYEGRVRDGFFFCRAGINIGSVLADGSISACPSMRSDHVQGSIHTEQFMDVWEHRFGNMRDRSWTRTGVCVTCAHFGSCEGNGLHLRDGATGKLLQCHLEML